MASQITYLSILSFFLFNTLDAQTGEGCIFKTCSHAPGQVRINAIYDAYNNFIGGCNCGCDPFLSCPSPYVVNFDPTTLIGNCACIASNNAATSTTTTTTNSPHPNPFTPSTPPNAANTAEVICAGPVNGVVEPCQCPAGHQGPCIITCNGVDACVEQEIHCNNNGFDCTVNCMSETACEGATVINGPLYGSLTVNCIGEFSCEGGTIFNGNHGKDLLVSCAGSVACAEGIFNFGSGRGIISCTGDPESCQGALFNLYPNAINTPGAQFRCMGAFCPLDIPQPFSNAASGAITKTCSNGGNCGCPPNTKGPCHIICEGGTDACKDGFLECNNPGYPCTVNCNAEQACSGAASVMGPVGSSLTVYCNGDKACEGEVGFNGQSGTDMTVICNGMEACKGGPVFKYGKGVGKLECNGQPDSCSGGAVFLLLPNAEITPGMAFECTGIGCPASAPNAFNNVQGLPPPVQFPEGPVVVNPSQTSPPITTTRPQHPTYPSAPGTNHCCVTSLANFKQWQGICWVWTNKVGCLGEHGRCRWDLTQCLPTAPTCVMSYGSCAAATDCCSEMCVFSAPSEGICV